MTRAAEPNECVIYVRISQDRTGDEAGVERQLEECRAKADELGLTVTQVYRDNDVSATKANVVRPEFERLLADKPRVVVTWYVDRLYRKVTDLARIIESVEVVHAVRAGRIDLSTAAGRGHANILASIAQMEGELKGERQKSKHSQRRNAGKPWWSHRPFGYNRDQTVNEAEAEHVRQAFNDLNRGVSRAAIRRRWNEQGILTSTGRAWAQSTFESFIKHPRNGGLLEVDGELIRGTWPAIIEPDEWRATMGVIANSALQGRGQGRLRGLMSGLATCDKCGEVLRVGPKQARTGTPVYRTECAHATVPMEEMDRAIRNAAVRALTSPGEYLAQGATDDEAAAAAARAEATEIRAELDALAADYAARRLSRQQVATMSAPLNARLEALEPITQQSYRPAELWRGKSPAALLTLWRTEALDLTERRALVKQLLPTVKVIPRKGGKPFDPSLHLLVLDPRGEAVTLPTNKRAVSWSPVVQQS